MASEGWGLASKSDEQKRAAEEGHGRRKALPPAALQAGHTGIVWLHSGAIAIWLLVIVTLGSLYLAGKHVPPIILLIAAAAALGHALFLGTHLLLARIARQKARRAAAKREAA